MIYPPSFSLNGHCLFKVFQLKQTIIARSFNMKYPFPQVPLQRSQAYQNVTPELQMGFIPQYLPSANKVAERMCVKNPVHSGMCIPACIGADTSPPPAGTPTEVHPQQVQTPWAGTPPGQVHPLGRYTPWAGTPPCAGKPRQVQSPPRPDRHCSGRYASYWNDFLFFFIIM